MWICCLTKNQLSETHWCSAWEYEPCLLSVDTYAASEQSKLKRHTEAVHVCKRCEYAASLKDHLNQCMKTSISVICSVDMPLTKGFPQEVLWTAFTHWFHIWDPIWPLRLFGGWSGRGGCLMGPYHRSNAHIDKLVTGVIDFKCEGGFDLWHCLEVVVTSEVTRRAHTI